MSTTGLPLPQNGSSGTSDGDGQPWTTPAAVSPCRATIPRTSGASSVSASAGVNVLPADNSVHAVGLSAARAARTRCPASTALPPGRIESSTARGVRSSTAPPSAGHRGSRFAGLR